MFQLLKTCNIELYTCSAFIYLYPNDFASQERISNIAYNIVNGNCTPIPNESAPVYITVGDGGNLEGLATGYHQLVLDAFICSIN